MQYGKSQEAIDRLTAEQRRVTQEAGTERPFTGEYNDHAPHRGRSDREDVHRQEDRHCGNGCDGGDDKFADDRRSDNEPDRRTVRIDHGRFG